MDIVFIGMLYKFLFVCGQIFISSLFSNDNDLFCVVWCISDHSDQLLVVVFSMDDYLFWHDFVLLYNCSDARIVLGLIGHGDVYSFF